MEVIYSFISFIFSITKTNKGVTMLYGFGNNNWIVDRSILTKFIPGLLKNDWDNVRRKQI